MVWIAFIFGLAVLIVLATIGNLVASLLLRKGFRIQHGKVYWRLVSVIGAFLAATPVTLLVEATDAGFSDPVAAFLLYLGICWGLGLPGLLWMHRNWRSKQLPDPASIFE